MGLFQQSVPFQGKEVSAESFDSERKRGPIILLQVWAPWSRGTDLTFNRLLVEVVEASEQKVSICLVNGDHEQNGEFLRSLRVLQTPTVAVFRDGEHKSTLNGGVSKDAILDAIGT